MNIIEFIEDPRLENNAAHEKIFDKLDALK